MLTFMIMYNTCFNLFCSMSNVPKITLTGHVFLLLYYGFALWYVLICKIF